MLWLTNRTVQKPRYLREFHDLVELAFDLRSAHAEDRAVQLDILPTGELGVESGTHLE
jgi:hypothetical protein